MLLYKRNDYKYEQNKINLWRLLDFQVTDKNYKLKYQSNNLMFWIKRHYCFDVGRRMSSEYKTIIKRKYT
jgi:hypothetical protein